MPDADALVLHHFYKIGFCLNVGMGTYPLTHGAVNSFSQSRAAQLNEWDCDQLVSMSREYCSWLGKGKDRTCTSPWSDNSDEAIAENNNRIAEQMKSLRGRKKPQ